MSGKAIVGAMGHGTIKIVHRKTGTIIAEYLVNGVVVFDAIYKGDIVVITSGRVNPIWVPEDVCNCVPCVVYNFE